MEDVTLITVIQSEQTNSDFLNLFFDYYFNYFKISKYKIIIQGNEIESIKDDIGLSCLYPHAQYEIADWREPFNDQDKISLINYYKLQSDTDYTLVVDVDEFVSGEIIELKKKCPNADYFKCELLDAISNEDKLLKLLPTDTWQTLFRRSKIIGISKYFGCDVNKYSLTRKEVQLGIGQHDFFGEYKGIDEPITSIYHFKWMLDIIKKLEYRLIHLNGNSNSAWMWEMIKQYIHLKKYNGFNLDVLKNGKIIE